MSKYDDGDRLRHMIDVAREAMSFVAGMSREQFLHDRIRQLAVTACLQVVGEAARHVSEARRQAIAIRWHEITGMRNRLVHEYLDINVEIVWKVVSEELAPLVARLEESLNGGA